MGAASDSVVRPLTSRRQRWIGSTPTLDDPQIQRRSLESLERATNYNRWLVDLALPYLGDDPLEIGSGFGYFARSWLEVGVPRITVSEIDRQGTDRLTSTFADDPRVEVREIEITAPPTGLRRFSAVVALNVLEHVQDDVGALAEASQLVQADGAVVIFVPAHPWAMSAFDRAIGHYRRYTARGLCERFEAAGLLVETARYVNAPGLFAWLIGMKLLRRSPADASAVLVYDKLAVPAVRWLDERIPMPFGQSLFAVGRPSA